MMLNTPTFANYFDFTWIFHILAYQVIKLYHNTKNEKFVSLTQTIYTKCAKQVDEKNRLFCCVSVRDLEPKLFNKGLHLTN